MPAETVPRQEMAEALRREEERAETAAVREINLWRPRPDSNRLAGGPWRFGAMPLRRQAVGGRTLGSAI